MIYLPAPSRPLGPASRAPVLWGRPPPRRRLALRPHRAFRPATATPPKAWCWRTPPRWPWPSPPMAWTGTRRPPPKGRPRRLEKAARQWGPHSGFDLASAAERRGLQRNGSPQGPPPDRSPARYLQTPPGRKLLGTIPRSQLQSPAHSWKEDDRAPERDVGEAGDEHQSRQR